MNEIKWNVWDPQKGQEYVIRDEKTMECFSNLEEGFLVVEIVGDFRWEEEIYDIAMEFRRSSSIGYFEHRPWQKQSLAQLRRTPSIASVTQDTDGAIRGQFDVSKLRDLIGIWSTSGRWTSGEWLIVGLSSKIDVISEVGGRRLVHALRFNKNLQIAVELQEMKQSFIYARESADSAAMNVRAMLGRNAGGQEVRSSTER